jgi:membrane dipeptidase
VVALGHRERRYICYPKVGNKVTASRYCCIPRFLGGTGDIAAMMKHIDYVVKKFGSDYVGIGTDVAYISTFAGEEELKITKQNPARTRWEALWPKDDFPETDDVRQSMA